MRTGLPQRLFVFVGLALAGAWSVALSPAARRPFTVEAPQTPPGARWFKGNTHTHTLNSDGDSTPDEVVRWYRDHRYHFLVLTDHNFLTNTEALQALHGATDRFLIIPGEEVSDRFNNLPLHTNGLNVSRQVAPQGGSSVTEILQRNVDAIRDAGGIPHINHPNFRWAITPEQLGAVRNNRLFEVYNGHPEINHLGGGGVPGLEEAWDSILTRGTLLFGIAVDDAHVFKQPPARGVSGPGRGWVMVRAERLETPLLLAALERGDFYASTGVELTDYQVTSSSMTVTVKPSSDAKYRVQFIGRDGRVLKDAVEMPATYTFQGDEGYVRAKVIESNGAIAWCQPVIVR